MKKSTTLALGIAAALGFNSAYALTLYCVHDDGLNDSQFCQGTPFGAVSTGKSTPTVIADGPVYEDCDIEALDVRFDPSGTIYAASGDDTPRPGHLYRVEAPGGILYDLGPVYNNVGERMMEIDAISVLPSTGEIWGWSQGQGLFVIDPDEIPYPGVLVSDGCTPLPPDGYMTMDDPDLSPSPIIAQEEIPSSDPIEIEDLEWNLGGTILYGVENDHCGHNVDSHGAHEDDAASDRDYDCGINLWAYFKDQEEVGIQKVCTDLLPEIADGLGTNAEIEGLEALSRTFLSPTSPGTTDTLVLTFHGPYELRYAVITKPTFPLSGECTLLWSDKIIVSPELNDIEGVGVSPQIDFSSVATSKDMAMTNDQATPADQTDSIEAAADWAAWIQEAIEESPNGRKWEEELPEGVQP